MKLAALTSILAVAPFAFGIEPEIFNNAELSGLSNQGLITGNKQGGGFWSELQRGNGIAGFKGSITNNADEFLADDFTISGSMYKVTAARLWMYQTSLNTPSITGGMFEIRKKTGSGMGAVVSRGTFQNSSLTDIFRIYNKSYITNRQLQQVDVNFYAILAPGEYYLVWAAIGNPNYTGPWTPCLTKVGAITMPNANALQSSNGGASWFNVQDGAKNQEFPFILYGKRHITN